MPFEPDPLSTDDLYNLLSLAETAPAYKKGEHWAVEVILKARKAIAAAFLKEESTRD